MARRRATVEIGPGSDPRFEGTAYSSAECQFLLDHLGEPSIVALPAEGEALPEGVNESAVTPILDRTHQLHLYEDAQRQRTGNQELQVWVGFAALRKVLEDTLTWRDHVKELKRRTRGSRDELRRAAGAPSLCMWDPDTDIPYMGGIGSDAERVLTMIDEGGVRRPLYTELHQAGDGSLRSLAGVAQFVKSSTQAEEQNRLVEATPTELVYEHHVLTSIVQCPICFKSEEYENTKPTSKRAALMRMMSHLKTAEIKRDQHELLAKRLKSGKSGSRQNAERVRELDIRRVG